MATSSSASCASAAAVPPGFRYETRYVVLNYLGMLPANRSLPPGESGRRMKEQIEEELRRLEEEVSASFPGFDRRQSPVFCPPNPDGSVEDCLAAIGDRVSRELGPHLAAAAETLLAGPLDYEIFQSTTLDLARHTKAGWHKVLVPLVLLQALQTEGKPLTTLLQLGLRCLEEDEAPFITQQGGWGKVLVLEQEEELAGPAAVDDSNDIYILSEEQLSPPSSLLCAGDSGDPSSWQTDSLAASLASHESWAQVAAMDPEDVKSLDSAEGAALAEERSDNNSSNSDIVHVEREEAELLEEGGAIDESTMSLLGTESDLAALRAEFGDPTPAGPPPPDVAVETTSEPEPLPPDAQPEPADPVPVEAEPTHQVQEIAKATAEPEAPPEPKQEAEPATLPQQPEPEPEVLPEVSPVLEAPAAPEPAEELPVLLYAGAVLVLLAAAGCAVVLLRRRR